MVDIVTPYTNVPEVSFWEELARLNEKRKILFAPPPLQKINNPYILNHCFVCNKMTSTSPYFSLSVCDKCYRNRTNISDFKHQTMVSTIDTCNICGKFFMHGVMVLNVPLCDYCKVYLTNVIRRAFGLPTYRLSL
jgi:hypothetical protein